MKNLTCPVCGSASIPDRRESFPLLCMGLIVHHRRCSACGHRFQHAEQMTPAERDRARAALPALRSLAEATSWLETIADGTTTGRPTRRHRPVAVADPVPSQQSPPTETAFVDGWHWDFDL